jgi:hypothetical protein
MAPQGLGVDGWDRADALGEAEDRLPETTGRVAVTPRTEPLETVGPRGVQPVPAVEPDPSSQPVLPKNPQLVSVGGAQIREGATSNARTEIPLAERPQKVTTDAAPVPISRATHVSIESTPGPATGGVRPIKETMDPGPSPPEIAGSQYPHSVRVDPSRLPHPLVPTEPTRRKATASRTRLAGQESGVEGSRLDRGHELSRAAATPRPEPRPKVASIAAGVGDTRGEIGAAQAAAVPAPITPVLPMTQPGSARAPSSSATAPRDAAEPLVVQVRIGRVEVRSGEEPPAATSPPARPVRTGFDEYLDLRSYGHRNR